MRAPDTIYLPTPAEVVTAMLRMAKVGPGDVVYDLGSGDGRIPIAAVKEFGAARGVGVELDATRVQEANENARRAGVETVSSSVSRMCSTLIFGWQAWSRSTWGRP